MSILLSVRGFAKGSSVIYTKGAVRNNCSFSDTHYFSERGDCMTANKFLEMLGMSDKELEDCINRMSEEEAKEALYQMVSHLNETRRAGVEDMFKGK